MNIISSNVSYLFTGNTYSVFLFVTLVGISLLSFILTLFCFSKVLSSKRKAFETQEKLLDQKEPFVEAMSLIEEPLYLKDNKYPAKLHNRNIWNNLQKKISLSTQTEADENTDGIFWLVGGNEIEPNKYCDTTKPFRQERYFYYMSGCNLPNSYILYHPRQDKLILFIDNVDPDDIMWSGLPISISEAKLKYDVDDVKYVSELFSYIEEYIADNGMKNVEIYTTDMDSWTKFAKKPENDKILNKFKPNDENFFWCMDEARLIKDKYEIETIKHACRISDNSHMMVMSNMKNQLNEFHLEAEFQYHSMRNGSHSLGYESICCSNESCGILHYINNDKPLSDKESILVDMGSEWENYTSDVTRCFPVNGKFTKEHLTIYNIVKEMQSETMKLMKPGASWESLHLLSHKILINEFIKIGIIKSDKYTVDEILDSRISCAFYPHGLGHLMGLDVHDVGGSPNYNDPDPMFKYLRLRRLLMENMVVTNEPGCYFNNFLIDKFIKNDEYKIGMINWDILKKYMYIGGVRIEDDILITSNGYENMTHITSDPTKVEAIVSKGLNK